MKLYILHTGFTKVPYGQFYSGKEGWTGIRAFWHMATDKSHFIWVPIHAYLIVHPKAGPILVDAGISWEQASQHKKYYKGIFGATTDIDEYRLDKEQELPAQLKRLGYDAADIRTVILTHLHEDHVGALKYFPHAKVMISKKEWELRDEKILGFRPMYYKPSFSMITNWNFISFDSGAFHCFDRSEDLFNDGSLIMLPTPGHSGGHAALFLDMGEYQIFLAGDSLYTLRHLDAERIWAFIPGSKSRAASYADSIRRINLLRKQYPDMVIIPNHDHYDYQFGLLHPFFLDGTLAAADRERIKAYENCIFDREGRLVPRAVPRYAAPVKGNAAGTAEADLP